MLKINPNDPLDQAILQVLRGEPVWLDEWEDLKEELDEEDAETEAEKPDFEEYLTQIGLTLDEAIRLAREFQADFRKRAKDFGLPLDDVSALVRRLAELAETSPSQELLRFYCELLCSSRLFFQPEDEENPDLIAAADYIQAREDTDEMYQAFCRRIELAERFQAATSARLPRNRNLAEVQGSLVELIFQKYNELLEDQTDLNKMYFRDNLEVLVQMAVSCPSLHLLAPLFIYQVIVRHASRLHNQDFPKITIKKLWNYHHYNVETSEDKMISQDSGYLRFFGELCRIFQNDPEVDLELCGYGYDQISNLGDFYRTCDWIALVYYENHMENLEFQEVEDAVSLMSGLPLYLPKPLEDILDEAPFSCYGPDENIILTDEGISAVKYRRFLKKEQHKHTLKKIEAYVNKNLDELLTTYCALDLRDGQAVREFCSKILQEVRFSAREQPKNMFEIAMFSAAIHDKFMLFAMERDEEYLKYAGLTLLKSRI